MDDIRVTYSGLVAFGASMVSVVTGMIFIIIVTRQLTPEEFGVWSIIGSMTLYFLVSASVISYWTVRQVARDEPVGRTAVASGLLFSLGSVPLYLVMTSLYSAIIPELHSSMALAAILIPAGIVHAVLHAVNMGHRPHVTGYSILLFNTIKIPFALALVYFLDLGLDGAIVAVFLALISRIIMQAFFARKKLAQKFNPAFLYRWMRLSWIPAYTALGNYIWISDIVIFPLIVNSVVGVAYYAAAIAVSQVVLHASAISVALYPKLIAAGKHQYIAENLTRQLFFLLPMLGLTIVFSKPALYVLNPVYQEVYLAVVFLSLYRFVAVLIATFDQILMGLEKIDVESNPGFRKLVHSRLFLVPTMANITYSLYIAILVVILLLLSGSGISELYLVTVWSVLMLVLSIPFMVYRLVLVRRTAEITFPKRQVLVYGMATLVFMGIYYATVDHAITYDADIYGHIAQMVLLLTVCAGVYLAITYAADPKTRHLTRQIVSTLKSMSRKSA